MTGQERKAADMTDASVCVCVCDGVPDGVCDCRRTGVELKVLIMSAWKRREQNININQETFLGSYSIFKNQDFML